MRPAGSGTMLWGFRMSQVQVVGLTLAVAVAFFAGRGYEQAKVRYALWRLESGTRLFGKRVRGLVVVAVAVLVGVAVLAVQARR